MLFGLLFAIGFILLLIRVVTWLLGLGYVVAVIIDMVVIGGFVISYAHTEWFLHIASGKAVYFWDVVLFVFISFVYGSFLVLGTNAFPRIASIFHYLVAWLTTGFIYMFINYAIYDQIFGPLLDHEQMNTIVHLIIISLLSIFIFTTRMRIFKRDLA